MTLDTPSAPGTVKEASVESKEEEKKHQAELKNFKSMCQGIFKVAKSNQSEENVTEAISKFHKIVQDLVDPDCSISDDKRIYFIKDILTKVTKAIIERQYKPGEEAEAINVVFQCVIDLIVKELPNDHTSLPDTLELLFYKFSRFYLYHGLEKKPDPTDRVPPEEDNPPGWREKVEFGDWIDVKLHSQWRAAQVTEVTEHSFELTYEGLSEAYDEKIDKFSRRLAPLKSKTAELLEPWRQELTLGSPVDVQDMFWKWYTAKVIGVNPKNDTINIHYDGYLSARWDEHIPRSSPRLAPFMTYAKGGKESGGVYRQPNGSAWAHDRDVIDDDDPEGKFAVFRGRGKESTYLVENVCRFGDKGGFDIILVRLKDEKHLAPKILAALIEALSKAAGPLARPFALEYIPKLKEATFELILSYSDAELRQLSKENFDDISIGLETLLKRVSKKLEVLEDIEQFGLKMALKRFKSSNIELRLGGLSYLQDVCNNKRLNHNKSEWLSPAYLLEWLNKNEIMDDLFGPNSHPQLMKRSADILKFICNRSSLEIEHLDLIWNAMQTAMKTQDDTMLPILYKVLDDISFRLSVEHLDFLFGKMRSIPFEDYVLDTIDLINKLSKYTHKLGPDHAIKAMDLLWEIIQDGTTVQKTIVPSARVGLEKILAIPQLQDKRVVFLDRCTDNIKMSSSVYQSLKLLQKVVQTYPSRRGMTAVDAVTQYSIINQMEEKAFLSEVFFADLRNYTDLAREAIAESGPATAEEKHNLVISSGVGFLEQLKGRLIFLRFILGNSAIRLTKVHIDVLWDCLVVRCMTIGSRAEALKWLRDAIGDDAMFEDDVANYLYSEKLRKQDFRAIGLSGYQCLEQYFLHANHRNGSLELLMEGDEFEIADFDTLVGLDAIWDIAIQTQNPAVVDRSITFLISVHDKVTPVEKNDLSAIRRSYIERCMSKFKQFSEAEEILQIERCLELLTNLLDASERRGIRGLKPHGAQSRGRAIDITLNPREKIVPRDPKSFKLRLYSRNTLWEFRCAIAEELHLIPDFIRIELNNRELPMEHNAKFLSGLKIKNHTSVNIRKVLDSKRRVDLLEQAIMIPAAKRAFSEIFLKFASNADGSMSTKDMSEYILACGAGAANATESRIKTIFYDHSTVSDRLNCDGFLSFYQAACETRPKAVWDDLTVHNYTWDLRKMEDVAKEEAEGVRYEEKALPRSILSKNPEYFQLLFQSLKLNERVAKKIWNLLMRLPTNPNHHHDLVSLDVVKSPTPDWNLLLDSKSVFKLLYSLQIIENLSHPHSQNDADHKEDEKTSEERSKWRQRFLLNGGFEHLYNVFNDKEDNFFDAPDVEEINKTCLAHLLSMLSTFILAAMSVSRPMAALVKRVRADSEPAPPPPPPPLLPPNRPPPAAPPSVPYPRARNDGYIPLAAPPISSNPGDCPSCSSREQTKKYCASCGAQTFYAERMATIIEDRQGDSGSFAKEVKTDADRDKKEKEVEPEENKEEKEKEKDTEEDSIPPEFTMLVRQMSTGFATKLLGFVDLHGLATRLTDVISATSLRVNFHDDDSEVLTSAINLWVTLLCYEPDLLDQFYSNVRDSPDFIFKPLHCPEPKLRQVFARGLHSLCLNCTPDDLAGDKWPSSIFLEFFLNNIPSRDQSSSGVDVEEHFWILTRLLEDHLSGKTSKEKSEKNSSIDFKPLFQRLVSDLKAHKSTEVYGRAKTDKVLVGILKLLLVVVTYQKEFRLLAGHSKHGGLIHAIFERFLFTPDGSDPKCITSDSRNAAFNLLVQFCRDCEENFDELFALLKPQHDHLRRLTGFGYNPLLHVKSPTGFVGLRNMGATCYMNSLLQQFYMMPKMRYVIFAVEDQSDTERKENILYQLQHMFGFLTLSDRHAYDTEQFCHSYKDERGNPVNPRIQQDVYEFFNVLAGRLENQLKETRYKHLLQDLFGGQFINQMICLGGCKTIREREEDFLNVSVQIKNRKNLDDSLNALVGKELLQGVNCDACKQKADTHKRVVLARLANTMIVHLKRFELNYETFQNEKINARYEFPETIDFEPYTKEGLDRLEAEKEAKENPDVVVPAKYTVHPREYYVFSLTGIIVHMGTADAGHYYSFIKSRDSDRNQWYEFNDSIVKTFDFHNVERECFGGEQVEQRQTIWGQSYEQPTQRIRNAYMLVYERASPYETPPTTDDEGSSSGSSTPGSVTTTPRSGNEDPFKPLQKLIEKKEKKEKQPTKIEYELDNQEEFIDRSICQRVREDNIGFTKDRQIFNPAYFRYVLDFLRTSNTTSVKEYSCSEEDNPGLKAIQLGVKFLFITLARSGQNSILPEFTQFLKTRFDDNIPACVWFLEHLADDPQIIADMALQASDEALLTNFTGLVVYILKIVCPFENSFFEEIVYVEDPADAKEQKSDGDAGGAVDAVDAGAAATAKIEPSQSSKDKERVGAVKIPKSSAVKCMNVFVSLINVAQKHWTRFTHFFHVLLEFARIGGPQRKMLINAGTIGSLGQLFLDETGKQHRLHPANLNNVIKILAILGRSCATPSTEEFGAPPTIMPGDICDLTDLDKKSLLSKDLYVRAIASEYDHFAVGDILVHYSYEWQKYSDDVASFIVDRTIKASHLELRPFFDIMSQFLNIKDSLQEHRIKQLTSPRDGLLTSIQRHRVRHPKWTYKCIKYLLNIVEANEVFSQHMANIHSQWSWMNGWLRSYVSDKHHVPELARQQSAQETLGKLEDQVKNYKGDLIEEGDLEEGTEALVEEPLNEDEHEPEEYDDAQAYSYDVRNQDEMEEMSRIDGSVAIPMGPPPRPQGFNDSEDERIAEGDGIACGACTFLNPTSAHYCSMCQGRIS